MKKDRYNLHRHHDEVNTKNKIVSISFEMWYKIFCKDGFIRPQPSEKWIQSPYTMGFTTELPREELLQIDPKWQEYFDLLDAHCNDI